ncbi:MAG: hypothetical protein WAO91_02915 [Candidatus Nitrosotenuis sp.]
MKQTAKIAIIAGICAAVIIGGLALFVHLKLSEVEKNETGQESAEQIAKETQDVLGGKELHPEQGEESHSEENESAEQRTAELPP